MNGAVAYWNGCKECKQYIPNLNEKDFYASVENKWNELTGQFADLKPDEIIFEQWIEFVRLLRGHTFVESFLRTTTPKLMLNELHSQVKQLLQDMEADLLSLIAVNENTSYTDDDNRL